MKLLLVLKLIRTSNLINYPLHLKHSSGNQPHGETWHIVWVTPRVHDTQENNFLIQEFFRDWSEMDLRALMTAQLIVYMHMDDIIVCFRAGVGIGGGLIKSVPSFHQKFHGLKKVKKHLF